MRRFTSILATAAFLGLSTQVDAQGTRNSVVLEVFTGTWCTYCPGSAMGTDDLIHNGKKVAPVKYHIGDSHETGETTARDSYYAVTGYPTSWFDGKIDIVGGNASQSIYPAYLPEYNTAIAAATPFDITASASVASNTLTIIYTVSQVGSYSAGNLVAHVVATESHIPENWLAGLTEVNFTVRKMAPDQNGTAITLTQGSSFTDTVTITLNPAWVQSNMEFVVFLQNTSTKEIFNSYRGPIQPSSYSIDPEAGGILNPITGTSCASTITPEITIFNNGNTALTTLDIGYDLNGTTGTFNWSGNLPFYTYATLTLPTINFTPQANNTLTITLTNPNSGQTDEDMNNNQIVSTWNGAATHLSGTYTLNLQLDRYGSETTWEFFDGSGNVIASGGPYQDTPSGNPLPALITETVAYSGSGCAKFRIYDSYGDGICCSYGQGSFTVLNAVGASLATGGQFTSEDGTDWNLDPTISIDRDLSDEVSVFPSPTRGEFTVTLGEGITGESQLSVLTLEGKVVFTTLVTGNTYKGNISDLASGVYMVKVQTESGMAVKKVTKD